MLNKTFSSLVSESRPTAKCAHGIMGTKGSNGSISAGCPNEPQMADFAHFTPSPSQGWSDAACTRKQIERAHCVKDPIEVLRCMLVSRVMALLSQARRTHGQQQRFEGVQLEVPDVGRVGTELEQLILHRTQGLHLHEHQTSKADLEQRNICFCSGMSQVS